MAVIYDTHFLEENYMSTTPRMYRATLHNPPGLGPSSFPIYLFFPLANQTVGDSALY